MIGTCFSLFGTERDMLKALQWHRSLWFLGRLRSHVAFSPFPLPSCCRRGTVIKTKLLQESFVFLTGNFCRIKGASWRAIVEPRTVWYLTQSLKDWALPLFSLLGKGAPYLGRMTCTLLGTIMLFQLSMVLVLMWGMMAESGVELSLGSAISMLMLSPW